MSPEGITSSAETARPWWRVPPYTLRALLALVVAFVVMTALWTGAGLAYVEWLEPSAVGDIDTDISLDLEAARTDSRTELAELGSKPTDPTIKYPLLVLLLPVFLVAWRRWHDWALLTGTVLLELSVYGLSSSLIGRERPPVERFVEKEPASWPSGHVAAAVAIYGTLAVIVWLHTSNIVARVVAVGVAASIIVIVSLSRLYLGMHYFSDVIAGILLGATSLLVAYRLVEQSAATSAKPNDPPQTRRLDLYRTTMESP